MPWRGFTLGYFPHMRFLLAGGVVAQVWKQSPSAINCSTSTSRELSSRTRLGCDR